MALRELDREDEAKRCLGLCWELYETVFEAAMESEREGNIVGSFVGLGIEDTNEKAGEEEAGKRGVRWSGVDEKALAGKRRDRKTRVEDLKYEDLIDLVAFWSQ
jgi:hypothetical protein